jgi:O-antigen ligase
MRRAPGLRDNQRTHWPAFNHQSAATERSHNQIQADCGQRWGKQLRTELTVPQSRIWLIDLAGIFYAISMHKYAMRDPLSADTGVQGIIETLGITGAFICTLMVSWKAKRWHGPSPVAMCFSIFGVFALASSWRSYSPSLSFAKAILLLVVLATGYLAGQVDLGQRFFRSIYQSYSALFVVGLLVSITLAHRYPLLSVDAFSGRTRLSVFDTFAGVLGEDAALLLIVAPMIRLKLHWLCAPCLFIAVVLAGGKMSTALLCLVLLIRFFSRARGWRSWDTLAVIGSNSHAGTLVHAAESIYGNQVTTEAKGMDGRLSLWAAAIDLLGDAQLLGYGIDGDREIMLRVASWSGSSHSGYLELALAGGILGFSILLLGFALISSTCLRASSTIRLDCASALTYIFVSAAIGGVLKAPSYIGLLTLLWLSYEMNAQGDEGSSHPQQSPSCTKMAPEAPV